MSNLFFTRFRNCSLCLSTQKRSDNDIATLFELLIAFSKAFLGSPSSHKYPSKKVISALKKRFDYVFRSEGNIPGTPNVSVTEINGNFKFFNKEIIVLNAFHGKLPVYGYRIGGIAYFTDVKTIPETEFLKLKNLDVLIINALRVEEHYSHLNLNDALDIINKIGPKVAYLTHISHKLGFHKDVQAQLPKNVFLAYDGLEVVLD